VTALIIAFVLTSVNPIGGLMVSIPLAVFKIHWPGWLAVLLGVPLAYVQVMVVDFFWERLLAWPWWVRFIEKRRSPRLERFLAHRYSFLLLATAGPWMGPWLVMAVARFGGRHQSQIALPMLIGLTYIAIGIAAICVYAPKLLAR
jgi:hypothetical protein